MNFYQDNPPTIAALMSAILRAEDEQPSRYGEEPDPSVERAGLARLAARLAGGAYLRGEAVGQVIGIGACGVLCLEVAEVAEVMPVQVAVLRRDGALIGIWPWSDAVEIWPEEMQAAGIDALELAAMERQVLPRIVDETVDVPWGYPADGGESWAK